MKKIRLILLAIPAHITPCMHASAHLDMVSHSVLSLLQLCRITAFTEFLHTEAFAICQVTISADCCCLTLTTLVPV